MTARTNYIKWAEGALAWMYSATSEDVADLMEHRNMGDVDFGVTDETEAEDLLAIGEEAFRLDEEERAWLEEKRNIRRENLNPNAGERK